MAAARVYLFVGGLALIASPAARGANPLGVGRYCLKQKMVKDWDPGPRQVGHFEMYLKVGKKGGRYTLSFWNVRPFAGPILAASTNPATLLSDGSLQFHFVDGWDNEGRAQVRPNDKVILTKTKSSARADSYVPDENYDMFRLTRAACADKDFARYR